MQEKPKPLTIRPSWPTRLLFAVIAVMVVVVSLDRIGTLDGDLFAAAVAIIFTMPAILLFGTKVTCADGLLTQQLWWHKTSVHISQLKRVEYYTQPVLGVNHILRLEDDQSVLRIIVSNYSVADTAQLANTIQESLVSSGVKTNFVVLSSLKNK